MMVDAEGFSGFAYKQTISKRGITKQTFLYLCIEEVSSIGLDISREDLVLFDDGQI
jgi:hypothetical protein